MMVEYVCAFFKSDIGTELVKRERIVRCRDCSMYDAEDVMCLRDPEHTGRGWHANPDGFCAWSEPRKED